MRARYVAGACCGLLLILVPALPAAADVAVHFVDPQRYTDIGGYGTDAERNLNSLERHLKTYGARCTRPGDQLDLNVTNVDLAGRREWWHGSGYDIRVMRDITWPSIELSYDWRDAGGQVLGAGRERVSDMNYLWNSAYVRNDSDGLPYEKAMLRDWFDRRFCHPKG